MANAARAFYPIGSSWPDGTVSLQLQLEVNQPADSALRDGSASWDQVAQSAIAGWNRNLVTTKLVGASNSTAQIGNQNGVNNVFWSTSIYGEAFDPYILGVTIVSWPTSNPTVTTETDVIFNTNAYGGWDSYRGPLNPNARNDFQRVALHEFGHVLGLDHPDDHGQNIAAVMNSVESDTDNLTDDDVGGATYLYGAKAAPTIVRQPGDLTTNIGGTAMTFDVEVRGRGPIVYQWLHNGSSPDVGSPFVPGQTRYGYVKVQGIVNDVGPYVLVVANPWGYTESVPANLATLDGLQQMPTDQVAMPDEAVTFRVAVAASTAATYQWSFSGTPLAETGPVLTLPSVQAADEGGYTVTVTIGSRTYTATALLRLALGFATPPQSQSVDAGTDVVLTVQAKGAATFTNPTDLAIDPDGNLYVSDSYPLGTPQQSEYRVRKITPAGVVTTVSRGPAGSRLTRAPNGDLFFYATNSIGVMVGDGAVMSYPGTWNSGPLVADSQGNLYIADTIESLIDRIAAGTLVAQPFVGRAGVRSSLDGKGLAASFDTLAAFAFAPDGTLYVSDWAGNGTAGYALIRKVTSDGTVTTLAGGSGSPGHIVDGTGSAAGFAAPSGLASDRNGNLFAADGVAIRKITSTGVVTTLAGSSTPGYADGVGVAARFSGDTGGVAVAADGTIYVVDTRNYVIRKIAPDGTVSTFAGLSGVQGSSDGSTLQYQWQVNGTDIPGATTASLKLSNFQVANDGNYTVKVTGAQGAAISAPAAVGVRPTIVTQPSDRSIPPGGSVTLSVSATSATGSQLTYQWQKNGVDIPGATGATLTVSSDQLQQGAGYFFVKVFDGGAVTLSRQVNLTTALVLQSRPDATITAKDGAYLPLVVTAQSTEEPIFGGAAGVTFDTTGNLYVTEASTHTIKKIAGSGVVSTLAGQLNMAGGNDGAGTQARFDTPKGIVLGSDGNLYVACRTSVRKMTPAGAVTTVAGSPTVSGSVDGTASAARFLNLENLAFDSLGNLFVADSGNHTIRKIDPQGNVSTYAGVAGVSGYVDGTLRDARLLGPVGLAIDGADNIFITDGNCVRKITPGGVVSTIAGQAQSSGLADGLGGAALFWAPNGIAIDQKGGLLVADGSNGFVRRITSDGWVSTVGGIKNLTNSSSVDYGVYGLAIDGNGQIYLGTGGAVSRISPDGVYSSFAGLRVLSYGMSPRDGAITRYQWSFNGVPIPGATANTYLIKNLQAASAGRYSVTVGNSFGTVTANTQVAEAASPPWIVIFDNSTQNIPVGGTEIFSVIAGGTGTLSYQWLKKGIALPGATASTLTIANAQPADQASYAVTVTSALGSVTSLPSALNIANATAPVITPRPFFSGIISSGGPLTLSVTASGSSGLSYQWSKDGVDLPGATASSLSLPHALASDSGGYAVRVSDAGGSVVSAVVNVVVPPAQLPEFSIAPSSATARIGDSVILSSWATATSGVISFQWQKDGQDIPGANGNELSLGYVTASDQGVYTVRAITDAGTVTSPPARVTVLTVASFAGSYFGTFDESGGKWALYLANDGSGVFIAYIDPNLGVTMLRVKITSRGTLSALGSSVVASAPKQGDTSLTAPRLLATGPGYNLIGRISSGVFKGTLAIGGTPTTETMYGEIDAGSSNFTASFYDAYALGGVDGSTYGIVGPGGRSLFVVATPATLDAVSASLGSGGKVSATLAGGAQVVLAVDAANRTLSGTLTQPGSASTLSLQAHADGAPSVSHLVNISTRAYCGTGDNVTIGGFVIAGTGTKRVLIRAVGPTLTTQGIASSEVLADPTINLHQGSSVIASNDNWGDNTNAADIAAVGAQIGATSLASFDTNSAALLISLSPGVYSFVVNGKNATSGIVLIEVYDADTANTDAWFVNISSRAYATTGDGVAIGGFVISGTGPKRVLLRGIGPTLANLGINQSEILADPQIELHRGPSIAAANDNAYGSANWPDIVDTGARIGATPIAAPADPKSAALLLYLAPGAYSFIARGKSGASGIVLVEVYDAD